MAGMLADSAGNVKRTDDLELSAGVMRFTTAPSV
jgi:hypothetical protein